MALCSAFFSSLFIFVLSDGWPQGIFTHLGAGPKCKEPCTALGKHTKGLIKFVLSHLTCNLLSVLFVPHYRKVSCDLRVLVRKVSFMKSENRSFVLLFILSIQSSCTGLLGSGEADLGSSTGVGPEKSKPVSAWFCLVMVTGSAEDIMWPRLANPTEGKDITPRVGESCHFSDGINWLSSSHKIILVLCRLDNFVSRVF